MNLPTANETLKKTLICRNELANEWLSILFNREEIIEDISIASKNGTTFIRRDTELLEPEVTEALTTMIYESHFHRDLKTLGYRIWHRTQEYHNTRNKKVELTISWEIR